MKLIHSLDISEGISMDSLKPSIINSGEDTSFESILGMKDASGDDCMINTEKHSQINAQKDKPVTDIDGIGNNAKKMFEKVDLNSSLSSDISLRKETWNSGTLYDKSSEKENIVDTNEVRFDILSDEDDSLHLKISSDEDNSLEDEVMQSTSMSKEIYAKVDGCDLPVEDNFIGNDNSNERKTKLCSNKGDGGCSEHNTKEIVSNNIDDSIEKESSENQELNASSGSVTPGRKRTSCSSEKFSASSKRSKISASESEDCDVVLCDTTSDELSGKKVNATTKDNSEVKENKHPITFDKTDVKVAKDSFELSVDKDVVKMDVSEAEDKKALLKSEAIVDSKKELKSDLKFNPLPFLRNFSRAQLQSMTRNDLEELVLQKICEAITERSVCGELREIAVNLDQKLKSWQKKSLQLTKQVRDLSLVLKRYESDLQNKGPNVVPVKITRSVGLQVQMPGASHPANWNQEDPHWRKGEKNHSTVPASTSSTKSPMKIVGPKNPTPSSPSVKLTSSSSASQKVVENSKISAGAPTVPNSPSSAAKVLQTKSPITPSSNSSTNKTSQKQIIPSVNNRLKSASDLQVIDLTDAEDKTRTSVSVPTSSTVTADSTTSVASNVNNTAITTVGCRPIRVVPHPLSSTTTAPILSQTVTNAVASQRVAYYVPTTVPQRQLILSNSPQVRPSGVVVSHRPNSIPAIVLKPSPVVPVSAVTASNAIIRASNVTSAIQLGPSRSQPRPTHYLQRIPVSATPVQSTGFSGTPVSHPAPLPPIPPSGPSNANWKLPPPKPDLKISKVPNRNQQGIVLSWNMTVTTDYEEIASYQLFAYQEGTAPPSTNLWKKVGDVKALPLPMACTLTQFMEGHKYHFAVRAVDVYARYGPFSSPGNIVLTRN